MGNNNKNHVNIYYNEDEVHDAFKNYYNDKKQYSKVHIFTNNALPLSLYGEEKNVELYSTGGLWDKLKSWLAGEVQFKQHFSQLDISEENQERYRLIIKNGGTIIISEQDDSDDDFIEPNETIDVNSIQTVDSPLPSSISNNGKQLDENDENQLLNYEQTSNLDTESIFDKENSSLDHDMECHSKNELVELDDHIAEPSSFDESTEQYETDQNLYIADVNSSNPVPINNYEQEEYYEDDSRK